MTTQSSDYHAQIVSLLPAYLNGHLEEASAGLVREHLLFCASCQQEMATWEAIKATTRQVLISTPLPSPNLLDAVWTQIDASAQVHRRSPGRVLRRLWLILRSQIPLIHRSIWLASALVGLFGLVLSLFMALHWHAGVSVHAAGQLLVLFIVVVGASGCGFLCGSAVDPGFEWTVATPTSMRLLMLCRILLVLSYNLLLGSIASLAFVAVNGLGLWEMMQLWLGPLLFFSSLCLTASLFLGSVFALMFTAALEMVQAFPDTFTFHLMVPSLSVQGLGSTSPMLLIGALVLLVCAFWFVPRQPRLAG